MREISESHLKLPVLWRSECVWFPRLEVSRPVSARKRSAIDGRVVCDTEELSNALEWLEMCSNDRISIRDAGSFASATLNVGRRARRMPQEQGQARRMQLNGILLFTRRFMRKRSNSHRQHQIAISASSLLLDGLINCTRRGKAIQNKRSR